jgi:hypothetical protein
LQFFCPTDFAAAAITFGLKFAAKKKKTGKAGLAFPVFEASL